MLKRYIINEAIGFQKKRVLEFVHFKKEEEGTKRQTGCQDPLVAPWRLCFDSLGRERDFIPTILGHTVYLLVTETR